MVLAIFKNFCVRGSKYRTRFYSYHKNKMKIPVMKTKRKTTAFKILEGAKNNKVPDNQHIELPSKYSEGRHELGTPSTSETMPTSDLKYWPPAEWDDLFPIIPSIQENGTLREKFFDKRMKAIFGKVSKTKSPVIKVTSRHIKQLEALLKQLPQEDRSFVEVWITTLKRYGKVEKEGKFCIVTEKSIILQIFQISRNH